eukprot:902561-Alexandrium_andersonii.AAC.1
MCIRDRPATLRSLKRLAKHCDAGGWDQGAATLARRWHGLAAFSIARHLRIMNLATIDQRAG